MGVGASTCASGNQVCTGTPGTFVDIKDTIRSFTEILAGQHDDLPDRPSTFGFEDLSFHDNIPEVDLFLEFVE